MASLRFSGIQEIDEQSLRACLATQERDRLSLALSRNRRPNCGVPPFDAARLQLPLWMWPWTEWPAFQLGVFERDLARIERWYRARGFYDARVTGASSKPAEALQGATRDIPRVLLQVDVAEGQAVRVASLQLHSPDSLSQDLRARLLANADLHVGQRFDEGLYDSTLKQLQQRLVNAGYALATVRGEVRIDPRARSAEVVFTLTPGAIAEFGEVCIEGFEDLPAETILAATGLQAGTRYSRDALEEARTRLYDLRVFATVEVEARASTRTNAAMEQSPQNSRPVAPGPGPSPGTDTDGLEQRDASFLAGWQSNTQTPLDGSTLASGKRCLKPSLPARGPQVPVNIRVSPGRRWRYGLGFGIQVGDEDSTQATVSHGANQQWDLHLVTFLEGRNFLGGLRRLRIEERPTLAFPTRFPGLESETGATMQYANVLELNLDWPAFLDQDTTLRLAGVWDMGPDPYGGEFRRNDLRSSIGPERSFLQGRLGLGLHLHLDRYQPLGAPEEEDYWLFYTTQTLKWDSRDDRRAPHSGILAQVQMQEALPPSDFRYLRVTPDLRGYFSLPVGLVLAARAGLGMVWATQDCSRNPQRCDVESLAQTGDSWQVPRPYRLRGGGPTSVRGVVAGQLGLRPIDQQGVEGQVAGFPGGTRSWIASLELRIPLGESLGIALFSDAGDVEVDDSCGPAGFCFVRPNTTLGGGLRYQTLVGPLRLDVGWLPPALQGKAPEGGEVDTSEALFGWFDGAIHLTIGEAF